MNEMFETILIKRIKKMFKLILMLNLKEKKLNVFLIPDDQHMI